MKDCCSKTYFFQKYFLLSTVLLVLFRYCRILLLLCRSYKYSDSCTLPFHGNKQVISFSPANIISKRDKKLCSSVLFYSSAIICELVSKDKEKKVQDQIALIKSFRRFDKKFCDSSLYPSLPSFLKRVERPAVYFKMLEKVNQYIETPGYLFDSMNGTNLAYYLAVVFLHVKQKR